MSVTISADGHRLASGSYDDTVKLWDAESGACLQTFKGHFNSVISVAISADGSRLASGSKDSTVKLWDAESGDCLQTLNVGRAIQYRLFDLNYYSRFFSDISDMILDSSFVNFRLLTQSAFLTDYNRTGYSISADNLWITYKGDNLIWLPPDYRPSRLKIAGLTLAVGCKSGRVWVIQFTNIVG